jgi:long-chain fatty acid transport protein
MHDTPHLRRRFRRLLFVPCLALGWVGTARASSTLEILGATSGGNQLTARVLSHGSAATYFNPALLPEASPTMEVGVFGVASQGKIRLKARPDGVDVPANVHGTEIPTPDLRPGIDDHRPLPTAELPSPRSDTAADENVVYASIGMVRPLAGKSLVFGFYALLPVRAFIDQKGFFPDEREQYFSNKLHFELLGDRLDISTITFALGSQLADWLSIGWGIDVSILTETKMTVYVPNAADESTIYIAQDIHTDSKFKHYFGAVVRPAPRLSLIATVHLPFSDETRGENDLRDWTTPLPPDPNKPQQNPHPTWVRQQYTFNQGCEPLRVAMGASFRGRTREDGRVPWEVGLQLLGERWSKYKNRQGESPLDTWNNTVSYAIGGGFLWRDRHVTMDLGYVPSPVPDQTGRTNYVDNSRLLASLGLDGPVRFLGKDLEAGVTLFGSLLLPRDVTKDPNAKHPVVDEYPDTVIDIQTGQQAQGTARLQTNNPGYPGFKSTGYMVGLGATFRIAR